MALLKRWRKRRLDKRAKKEAEFLINNIEIMPGSYKKFLASYYPNALVRRAYLRDMGMIMPDTTMANTGVIVLPNNRQDVHVRLGEHVSIAPNVIFVCDAAANNGDEINTLPYVREHLTKKADIIVEDEAWIGANVTILPGVCIGRCAVIGAGSVVTKDVEAYCVYAGVPARKIRDLKTGERVDNGE